MRLRRSSGPKYLFQATFSADLAAPLPSPLPCDVGALTLTDTADHLSISGGKLVCDGGEASWGDPGGSLVQTLARVAGRALLGTVNLGATNTYLSLGFWDSAGLVNSNRVHVIAVRNDATLAALTGDGAGSTLENAIVTAYAGSTDYQFAIVLGTTGALFLIKGGAFSDWTLLWPASLGNVATLYAGFSNNNAAFTLDDSRLVDLAGAWASDFGIARAYEASPAAITPTLQAERFPNPEFTDDTAGWAVYSGATLTRRDYTAAPDIDPTGGIDDFGMEVETAGSDSAAATEAGNFCTIGLWYMGSTRAYAPSANTAARTAVLNTTGPFSLSLRVAAEDTWETLQFIALATATWLNFRMTCKSTTSGDLSHFDKVTLKAITLSTTLGTVYDRQSDYVAEVSPTLTAGTQAGLMLNIDDDTNPANFILAYHDGTNAHLDKCVAGTYTSLIDAAAGYGAGRRLIIVKEGTSVTLYYNNAKIGATQTIADAGVKDNTKHTWFSTYASNTFARFVIWPRNINLPQGV